MTEVIRMLRDFERVPRGLCVAANAVVIHVADIICIEIVCYCELFL